MSITLDQIKADIRSGKCKRIYYSSRTLWWTHLEEDVEEATKIGTAIAFNNHQKFMKRPDVPEQEKKRMDALFKSVNNGHRIPLDITAAPLFMYSEKKDVEKWIIEAEKKPEFFGKHGITAFLKAHHQNCNSRAYPHLNVYNEMIDDESNG